MTPTQPGADLLRAFERAWQAIAAEHPDLPPVLMVSGAGSDGRANGQITLGHFAAERWQPTKQKTPPLPELFVAGEGLVREPPDVFATLLHEAAHALANARSIRDTSRDGRYHNRQFANIATELGLDVTRHPIRGFSETTLTATATRRYHHAITALGTALTVRRSLEPTTRVKASRNALACECACGRRIRVAPSILEQAPIRCDACHQPFDVPAQ